MTNICSCPVATLPVPNGSGAGDADHAWSWSPFVGSYSFNGWFYQDDQQYGNAYPERHFKSDSGVNRPSQTPVFLDSNWVDCWPEKTDLPPESGNSLYTGENPWDGQNTLARSAISRHGGSNPGSENAYKNLRKWSQVPPTYDVDLALFDGHVEKSRLIVLTNYYWYVNYP